LIFYYVLFFARERSNQNTFHSRAHRADSLLPSAKGCGVAKLSTWRNDFRHQYGNHRRVGSDSI